MDLKGTQRYVQAQTPIYLYGWIAGLTAWQALKWEISRDAILSSLLAALIAIKAKLSPNGNGGSHDDRRDSKGASEG